MTEKTITKIYFRHNKPVTFILYFFLSLCYMNFIKTKIALQYCKAVF